MDCFSFSSLDDSFHVHPDKVQLSHILKQRPDSYICIVDKNKHEGALDYIPIHFKLLVIELKLD